jgi:hypothetical protein
LDGSAVTIAFGVDCSGRVLDEEHFPCLTFLVTQDRPKPANMSAIHQYRIGVRETDVVRVINDLALPGWTYPPKGLSAGP